MRHDYRVEAERLRLRPMEREDLELVLRWRNDERIRPWFFHSEPIEWERHLKWFEAYLDKEGDMAFMIEQRSSSSAVGTVSLYEAAGRSKEAEFGRFMIGDIGSRGQGFGTESAIAVCEFGFRELGLRAIKLEVFGHNAAAIGVYKAAGFRAIREFPSERGTIVAMAIEEGGRLS